jgi:hypothetical protein
MSPKLQVKLFKKYPTIFRYRKLPRSQSCMAEGITCGDGWYSLLDTLCEDIQRYINQPVYVELNVFQFFLKEIWASCIWDNFLSLIIEMLPEDERKRLGDYWAPDFSMKQVKSKIPELLATQVKEKFGTLRFYHDGGDEKIHQMILFAESLSGRICENCGKMDETVKLKGKHWVRTLCGVCSKAHKK